MLRAQQAAPPPPPLSGTQACALFLTTLHHTLPALHTLLLERLRVCHVTRGHVTRGMPLGAQHPLHGLLRLRSLTLDHCQLNAPTLEGLPRLSHLTHLDLKGLNLNLLTEPPTEPTDGASQPAAPGSSGTVAQAAAEGAAAGAGAAAGTAGAAGAGTGAAAGVAGEAAGAGAGAGPLAVALSGLTSLHRLAVQGDAHVAPLQYMSALQAATALTSLTWQAPAAAAAAATAPSLASSSSYSPSSATARALQPPCYSLGLLGGLTRLQELLLPDLVLTDEGMPGIAGMTQLTRLHVRTLALNPGCTRHAPASLRQLQLGAATADYDDEDGGRYDATALVAPVQLLRLVGWHQHTDQAALGSSSTGSSSRGLGGGAGGHASAADSSICSTGGTGRQYSPDLTSILSSGRQRCCLAISPPHSGYPLTPRGGHQVAADLAALMLLPLSQQACMEDIVLDAVGWGGGTGSTGGTSGAVVGPVLRALQPAGSVIRTCQLAHAPLTQADLACLAKACPQLLKLTLEFCVLPEGGAITPLMGLPHLRQLVLEHGHGQGLYAQHLGPALLARDPTWPLVLYHSTVSTVQSLRGGVVEGGRPLIQVRLTPRWPHA